MQNNLHTQHQTWPRPLTWLLACLGVSILALQCASPIHSNDLWWHMTLGRHILATGKLIVDHSIFTWTYATPYSTYNAWLSEVTLYLIYYKTGAIGLIALRYFVYSGFFALAAYFAIQRGIAANPLTWLIIALGIVLAFAAQTIQPEMLSFAFMCIIVWLYFSIRATGVAAWQRCYWFPVIMVLWVNSHGAFVMSAFFFLAAIIGELLNVKFSPSLAMPSKLRMHLFIAMALCIPALLLNPFGYALPLYLLQIAITFTSYMQNFSVHVMGWDPTFNYNDPPDYALDYLIMAMVIYIVLVWQRLKNQQADWVVLLTFIAYSSIFIKMMRTTHFLAPVFVFASLDLLAYKKNSWAWPQAQLAVTIQPPPPVGGRGLDFWPFTMREAERLQLARLAIAACSIAFIGIMDWRAVQKSVCYPFFGSLWAGDRIDSTYPTEEADYIRRMPAIKKLGNLYDKGGYLMYRLWPNILTMIDPRYFPFISWIEQYEKFIGGIDVQQFLDEHKADAWLINHDSSQLMIFFTNSKAWVPLFIGPAGVVFGPVSGSKTHQPLTVSPNVEHTTSALTLFNSFHTALELREWTLAERIRTRVASFAQDRVWCGGDVYYTESAQNMQIAITGTRAFYYGDYEKAAKAFKQKIPFGYLNGIARLANTVLAQRAWERNDYVQARTFAIDALKPAPKSVASVYNAAISDWQYRKAMAATKVQINDDINWQFLANILLTHKEQLSKGSATMLKVISAMQHGTLVEKPNFIMQ